MARSTLPPGFRFHPTDEELLVHYLKKKVAGRRVHDGVIGEIEIYKFEPADLPGLATLQSNDQEWFFFNAQDKKYLHGARTNRTTGAGYWKATGKDRKISAGLCVGMKKTLIFYSGRAPHGKRTDWVMHEYRLDEECEKKINFAKPFVLCRIRRKGGLGPRNGEQYGAPVLETSEEIVGDMSTSYPLEEACVLLSADSNTVEEQALDGLPFAIDEGVTRTGVGIGDDVGSFLQTLISYEEQEQQPVQDEVLSVDDLLDLVDNLGDFAVMEPLHAEGCTNSMELGYEDIDDFYNLLHAATDNESVILEDILHLASGQVECPDGVNSRKDLQQPLYQKALDDDNFIELADLEEPCNELGTIECSDFKELLYGVESTRLAQDRLQVQNLQSSGDRQSLRSLQHIEESGVSNEQLALEVPLDSSQGLSILDNIYTRFLTSDDGGGFSDDLPSGFDLNSGHEGGSAGTTTFSMAHSHSHSRRTEEPSETDLVRVDNLPGVINLDVQGGGHLSVSHEETEVAREEHVSIVGNMTKQPNSTAGSLNNNTQLNSSVGSLTPSPSSPSSFARVISEFLGKVDVKPASAAGMPVEMLSRKPLIMDNSKSFAVGSRISQSSLIHHSSSSISGASLHFRVKLIDLEHKHTASTPEMELQLLVAHTVSEQASTKPCKSLTSGLSLLLFRMTTLAVILFWIFCGFCRSMRSAFL